MAEHTAVVYERYGGYGQLHPPTPAELERDEALRETDEIVQKIGAKQLRWFTAAEFMWFAAVSERRPAKDALEGLRQVRELLARIEQREAGL